MSTCLLVCTPVNGVPVLKLLAIYIGNTPSLIGDLLNHYLLWLIFIMPPGHPITLAMEENTVSEFNVEMLRLDRIVIPGTARTIDESHAKKIARTIPIDGGDLLQPIGVVQEDACVFRIVWGGHRYRAYQILGRSEIPARILPPGTTPADEARYSLVENAARRREGYEEKLQRVENLAKAEGVDLRKAMELAEISPSEFNKCQTTLRKLKPKARQFAKEHKDQIGNSDLYLVASKATTEQQQVDALAARINGLTRNELASWLGVQKKPAPKASRPRKPRSHRHITGKTTVTMKSDRTCGEVAADLQAYLTQLLANPTMRVSELVST